MSGYVRIIGGKWRGKKLPVLSLPGLRPTPDRVRETVFNWLAPHIVGAHCLDLFAGSGAFGFEALSRGAATVTMFDANHDVVRALKAEAQAWQVEAQVTLQQATLPSGLATLSATYNYNIVFIDPPYDAKLLLPTCRALEECNLLADTSYIYLEASDSIEDQQLPQYWTILKAKKAGMVMYYLVKREKQHDG